jgi:uncharacterized coiled-coil protein SlyX
MSYTGSATAAWVAKYNAEVALYNAQVAATTVEHNARYVNNAGTGIMWIDQDAIDVAALNAANATIASQNSTITSLNSTIAARDATITSLNAQITAITPANLDTIVGSQAATSFFAYTTLQVLTIDRTGYWAASGWARVTSGVGGFMRLRLVYGGVVQAVSPDWVYPSGSGFGVACPAALLTSGTQIFMQGQADSGAVSTPGGTSGSDMRAWFVPTPTYPH